MASVQLDRVRKVYDNGQVAVHGASFEVADGELMVLVGPSGCGKSTLLRMVAGLETVTSGEIDIGGRVVNQITVDDDTAHWARVALDRMLALPGVGAKD